LNIDQTLQSFDPSRVITQMQIRGIGPGYGIAGVLLQLIKMLLLTDDPFVMRIGTGLDASKPPMMDIHKLEAGRCLDHALLKAFNTALQSHDPSVMGCSSFGMGCSSFGMGCSSFGGLLSELFDQLQPRQDVAERRAADQCQEKSLRATDEPREALNGRWRLFGHGVGEGLVAMIE
jgi:hypothetical protein